MNKEIFFDLDAQRKLKAGMDKLANTVRVTMGPRGRKVLLKLGRPVFTMDGVTVARNISLPEEVENMGAEVIKEAAEKTNDEAGDGTSTATLLVQSLATEGMKAIGSGLDPVRLVEGMIDAKNDILKEVEKEVRSVDSTDDMDNVATISSREPEMGKAIAEVYDKIGKDGVVVVEESHEVGIHHEVVDGMQIEQGFKVPHFITNPERRESVLNKPLVVLTDRTISTNEELIPLLEYAKSKGKPIVIVCDDISGEALSTAVLNKLKGIIQVVVVRAPGTGDRKIEMLEDTAIVLNGTVISEKFGLSLDEMKDEDYGSCERVVSKDKDTVFVGGDGKKKDIDKRSAEIRKLIDGEQSKYKKELLVKRLASLSQGIGVIRIGSYSESEQKERQYRLEDAVNATKSALQEGIVIGGGMALVHASNKLQDAKKGTTDLSYYQGYKTVLEAVKEPARQIIENAGQKADVVLSQCTQEGRGFNGSTGRIEDLMGSGVIDPYKVIRIGLNESLSRVALFLDTGALVAEILEKEKDKK